MGPLTTYKSLDDPPSWETLRSEQFYGQDGQVLGGEDGLDYVGIDSQYAEQLC